VKDAYGQEVLGPWIKEASHFTQTVFLSGLRKADRRLFPGSPAELDQILLQAIERRLRSFGNAAGFVFEAGMDPVAYEHYCADRLKAAGWRARATQASGDQGVDVLAEAAGRRLVLQCKLYDRPVGNAAVQEIIAGRQFEDAHHAVVVSNAAFTKSAQQLAAKSNVALLHHDELETYGRRLLA
jgi:restriction system protein